MSGLDASRMTELLGPWAEAHHGLGTTVADVAPMPGNAGLSFGFRVRPVDAEVQRLVVRLSPPGVRRQGNTDVLRQVPLLAALEAGGVPVAPVLWSSDDPRWFGTDAMVQPYLPALPLAMHEPAPPDVDVAARLLGAATALASVHAVDLGPLDGWGGRRTVCDEIGFWGRLFERAPDPDWVTAGRRLGDALLAHDPGEHRTGVFHGDYQTHNVLYDDTGSLAAIIDWEIAGIGAVGLDLGWLAMMVDPACWHDERVAVLATVADPHELRAAYESASGRSVDHFDWYRAFACFRYAAIATHNLYLHTSGRRSDEVSALMGRGVPTLTAAGAALLDE